MQYKQIFKNKNYIHFRLIQRRRPLCFISNNNIEMKLQLDNRIIFWNLEKTTENKIPKIIPQTSIMHKNDQFRRKCKT